MKQKVGPIAIVIAVLGVLGLMAAMFRVYFPPQQRSDTDNPNGMPAYAKNYINSHAKPTGQMPGH